ncbi:MAG TPA: hypothetical protein VN704_10150 [Verrucomicrobiae bacterium]|nr:hypothetical protein [Verrucomicrobiae bacterium]
MCTSHHSFVKNAEIIKLSISNNGLVSERTDSIDVNTKIWITFYFIRRWNVISSSIPISETKTSYPSSFEKSIIERTMQYIKDRTERFDDYFPCKKNKCKLHHIKQWFKSFVYGHNKEIIS